MKTIVEVVTGGHPHWVGDGFPVRSYFSYRSHGKILSPFLLLDYAGPYNFPPAVKPKGVGKHPHRGFETVTIVYQGEVAHQDSAGNGGVIGPGDVQWMTAGSGLLHEEFHSPNFTRHGGTLEMVQLWVNLPAKKKMVKPKYQAITAAQIPQIALADDAGTLRLIAGHYGDNTASTHTYTPLNAWDLRLAANKKVNLALPEGWSGAILVLSGDVTVQGAAALSKGQLAILSQEGKEVVLETTSKSTVLLLSGESIDEPIVGHGPFVMNSIEEINQAIFDMQTGRLA